MQDSCPSPSARLYIAVRADLLPGLQLAQAVHAAFALARERPDLVHPWMHTSNYLIIVCVADEGALLDLIGEAARRGIARIATREPDLDDTVTAVALAPGADAQRLCASLPLALREGTARSDLREVVPGPEGMGSTSPRHEGRCLTPP